MKLLTLGHSNHSIERFLELVGSIGAMAVVDVRTSPASRFNPQFNRSSLEHYLTNNGIPYYFAGQYLGGRPNDPTCYKQRTLPPPGTDYLHEVDYPEVMRREWFVKGVQRLLEIADERAAAIMCSEEDPAQCHRHHLIAKYILQEHPEVTIYHVRGNGLMVNAASLHITVDEVKGQQMPLFDQPGSDRSLTSGVAA